jgi:uncharacterized protein (TIGR03067 family)
MRRLLLLALIPLALAFAPAPLPRPKPDPVKDDLKAMQGAWLIVSRTNGGRPLGNLHRIVIAGDQLTFYRPDAKPATTWTLTLDASKTPRCFERKRDAKGRLFRAHGVYELSGASLRMCYTRDGAELPTDFDDKKPGRWLEVYTRAKE